MADLPSRQFTSAECRFLAGVLGAWVNEGFETPPYRPEFYDVADKLGLQQEDVMYDIRRPEAQGGS